MENKLEEQNEEALLNAFKIEELEERLEMQAPWNGTNSNGCQMNDWGSRACTRF